MHRILLVDDSATDRTLLRGLLSRNSDYDVQCVASGQEALDSMASQAAQLVVTDMQMPEMDGLELVSRLRDDYPQVPVILITSHGSEALAAKALRKGAAGYVPKDHSRDLLCDTVGHLLTLSQAARVRDQLLQQASHTHMVFELRNDPSLIAPMQDFVQRHLDSIGLCDRTGCLQVGVALEHALTNSMYHGNLELTREQLQQARISPEGFYEYLRRRADKLPYRNRHVHLTMDIKREAAQFIVSDDGPGFDVQEVTSLGLTKSLTSATGQGLILMWALMDKVVFDRSGNKVTLVKRRQEKVRPQELEPAVHPRPSTSSTGRVFGQLVSLENGTAIELMRPRITVGRTDSCDVVIPHSTISNHHCLLAVYQGWWFIKDLQSKNGTKVNHQPVTTHLLRPGYIVSLGSLDFEIKYSPYELGAVGITPPVSPF